MANGRIGLKSQVDEAFTFARHLDHERLGDIIRLLHAARNRIIVRIGRA
jgi:hypothetical protein